MSVLVQNVSFRRCWAVAAGAKKAMACTIAVAVDLPLFPCWKRLDLDGGCFRLVRVCRNVWAQLEELWQLLVISWLDWKSFGGCVEAMASIGLVSWGCSVWLVL